MRHNFHSIVLQEVVEDVARIYNYYLHGTEDKVLLLLLLLLLSLPLSLSCSLSRARALSQACAHAP